MLEIRRLRLLLELQRRGTIAAVAEALHFSPSGVSQQLALLESEVGVPLLDRVGRKVRLTEAAQLLAEHADEVIRQMERAEARVLALAGQTTGTVRIATFQTAALTLVPRTLDQLAGLDGVRIELTQIEPEEALPALLARDFDLMIGEEYPNLALPISDDVDRMVLGQDALELALPESERTSSVPSLLDAADCAWVMEPPGSLSRQWALELCRRTGFEPDVQFESEDMLTHRELVLRGHAAAFLPALLSRNMRVPLSTHDIGQSRTIFSAVRQGRQEHPSILAVRAALAAACMECEVKVKQSRQ